jgi:hypothetical protein
VRENFSAMAAPDDDKIDDTEKDFDKYLTSEVPSGACGPLDV